MKAAFCFSSTLQTIFEGFHAGKANLHWISTLHLVTIMISSGSKSLRASFSVLTNCGLSVYISSEIAEQYGIPDSARALETAQNVN